MIAGRHVVTRRAVALALALATIAARATAAGAEPGASQAPAVAAGISGRAQRIAVLEFDPLGMDPEKVARLEALFRMELERLAGGPTPSPREIARALRGSRLAGCAGENTCLAAIGKKVGAELIVSGNVAELGDSYVVNIKAVKATTGAELRRIASDPLRGNPDELIDSVRVAAYRLLAPERLLGSISVLADIAGAEVTVDGRPVGRTPLAGAIANLSLGAHRLEVRAAGYSTFAEEVQVRFQKTTRVLVRLAAADPGAAERDLFGAGRTGPRPAPRRWYSSTWFLVSAGAAAVLVGALVGRSLARHDSAVDCDASPEACR